LVDIILFGSALKAKDRPRDLDICVLLRNHDPEQAEDAIYSIVETGKRHNIPIHCEPILVDDLHKEPLYVSLLHEGYSIRNSKSLRSMMKLEAFVLVTYSLEGKNASDKVRFSYALHGRKSGDGLLNKLGGKELGKGCFLVPVEKIEILREFFKQWIVKQKELRIIAFDS
jgi:hypothetical protein